jgi:hypothetical protein
MALFEEQITDTLETGAPSIRYTGKEGPRPSMQSQEEMMIAKQIWEAMGDEERGQFSNFEEFFASGIWKQILQQAQQDEAQGQQGIASLGPNQGSPSIMDRATTDQEVEDAYGVPVGGGIESLRGGI